MPALHSSAQQWTIENRLPPLLRAAYADVDRICPMNSHLLRCKLSVLLSFVVGLLFPLSLHAMDSGSREPQPTDPTQPADPGKVAKRPEAKPADVVAKPTEETLSSPEVSDLHSEITKLMRSRPAVNSQSTSNPTPAPVPPIGKKLESPSVESFVTLTNSLGMKFAKVGDVEFCLWDTRVQDFESFASAKQFKSMSWRRPGFRQGPTHPVVNVSWEEATAFCRWLTDTEHANGTLPANRFYRLPTDLEWSKAVGLPVEAGQTPEERDLDVPGVYPWGEAWPPPAGAGNYAGQETGSSVAIKDYDDGFAWTSPVGSYKPNAFGLYDMGGNVWQWCLDAWNTDSMDRVLRGGSWYNGALNQSLLSSCRVHANPDSSTDNYGFRCVLVQVEK